LSENKIDSKLRQLSVQKSDCGLRTMIKIEYIHENWLCDVIILDTP